MDDLEQLPTDPDIEARLEAMYARANAELAHHIVSFALGGSPSGSGTLIDVAGDLGVLTAAHVVDHISRHAGDTVEIVCRSDNHRLSVPKRRLQFIRFGPNQDPYSGPDIAFIRIANPATLATLRAIKSFLRLRDNPAPEFDRLPNKISSLCAVAGMPAEKSQAAGTVGTQGYRLSVTMFFGRTQITKVRTAGDFHYLESESFAAMHDFPQSYGGISGGSVWHIPICGDKACRDSLDYIYPELIGVPFAQSDFNGRARTIFSHSTKGLLPVLAKAITEANTRLL